MTETHNSRCRDCFFGRSDATEHKGKILCIADYRNKKHVSPFKLACPLFREDKRHAYRGWGVLSLKALEVKKRAKLKR